MLGRQPPVNNRFDARVAGDAVTTGRSMSAVDVDQANKSAVGGSILYAAPLERQKTQGAFAFSKSNDELNLTSRTKLQQAPKIPVF